MYTINHITQEELMISINVFKEMSLLSYARAKSSKASDFRLGLFVYQISSAVFESRPLCSSGGSELS